MTEQNDKPDTSNTPHKPATGSNKKILAKQWFYGIGGSVAFLAVIGVLIVWANDKNTPSGRIQNIKSSLDLEGLVAKPSLRDDWLSRNELRLEEIEKQIGRLAELETKNAALKQRLDAAAQDKQALEADAKRTLDVYEKRIADLERKNTQPSLKTPTSPARPATQSFPPAGRVGATNKAGVVPVRTVEVLRFEGEEPGDVLPVSYDVRNYLPPNAYTKAKILVGVDATVGVKAQTDPKPVEFRIIGPAYSASHGGKRLETDVEGCVVNGAAFGELSSEKVFVKLQKMTCPDGPTQVAVAAVEGYLAHEGKAGIRGRVVSREGDLVTQALLAGIAGGFGRGFSANANSQFRTVGIGSTDNQLSAEEILTGGLGQGAATAADTVSNYLIERAEQYQPVIEMPTGLEVELVFIGGAYIRREAS